MTEFLRFLFLEDAAWLTWPTLLALWLLYVTTERKESDVHPSRRLVRFERRLREARRSADVRRTLGTEPARGYEAVVGYAGDQDEGELVTVTRKGRVS